ncbi:hypothetical protein VPNG_07156 [Cytospora leucostoma]|uniref:Uncharacterized protein n=1 Tax=Cytospora leucostoma TaxID=1230097 RepID=A0A423WJP0_9PEZI|nr:hypothetical protein VPNG_07156 [Cytospora leucostoma]
MTPPTSFPIVNGVCQASLTDPTGGRNRIMYGVAVGATGLRPGLNGAVTCTATDDMAETNAVEVVKLPHIHADNPPVSSAEGCGQVDGSMHADTSGGPMEIDKPARPNNTAANTRHGSHGLMASQWANASVVTGRTHGDTAMGGSNSGESMDRYSGTGAHPGPINIARAQGAGTPGAFHTLRPVPFVVMISKQHNNTNTLVQHDNHSVTQKETCWGTQVHPLTCIPSREFSRDVESAPDHTHHRLSETKLVRVHLDQINAAIDILHQGRLPDLLRRYSNAARAFPSALRLCRSGELGGRSVVAFP